MKLVLYGDQIIPENRRIDERLIRMLGADRRIGYIPSSRDPSRRFFDSRRSYYAASGLDLAVYFDPEDSSGSDLQALLDCDAIHLSGGDTALFRNRLFAADMIKPLQDYATAGGILIGTSAGAILMTPTIAVDALFNGKTPMLSDDDAALNLTPFEFFPHFGQKPGWLPALLKYSRSNGRPIFCCPDGDGIVIDGEQTVFIGEIVRIADGDLRPA